MSIEQLLKGIADGEIKLDYDAAKTKSGFKDGKIYWEAEKIKLEISFPKRAAKIGR